MDNKTLSIISYITIIGWLVAFFVGKDKADLFLKYHLRQSFGLGITTILWNMAMKIIFAIVPSLWFLSYLGYLIFILAIIGIITAANNKMQPLPIIGKYFENSFTFLR